MEDNKEQNSSPGNEENTTAGNNKLRGAASKTGASGKSMIEENSAENTQGSGITAGNVIGGVNPEGENKTGADTSGGGEGTSGDLNGGVGTGISVSDDENTRMGTGGAGDNSDT